MMDELSMRKKSFKEKKCINLERSDTCWKSGHRLSVFYDVHKTTKFRPDYCNEIIQTGRIFLPSIISFFFLKINHFFCCTVNTREFYSILDNKYFLISLFPIYQEGIFSYPLISRWHRSKRFSYTEFHLLQQEKIY